MKAITFHGKEQVRYESIPDPQVVLSTDVVVKVKCCAICGSDLHVYHGREKGCDHATAMGHEFVGEIVEIGGEVTHFHAGELVMSPFTTSCGQCAYCQSGLTARCVHSQLFGWVQQGVGLQGGQAEYVRVPFADHTLLHVPDNISAELALLLGDVIPTGYFCAYQAAIQPEKSYVVIGCGAVGLMTILGAIELGATTVFAIDTVPERLQQAEAFGAVGINAAIHDAVSEIMRKTNGKGADAVMEAVGSNETLRMAYQLVRPGGIISVVGVNTAPVLPFSPSDAYDKNLTLKVGRCSARYFMDKLLPVVESGKYDYGAIITHHMELTSGVDAYRLFAERRDHCIKLVLHC